MFQGPEAGQHPARPRRPRQNSGLRHVQVSGVLRQVCRHVLRHSGLYGARGGRGLIEGY